MSAILPAIPGVTTFSCQSAAHYKCTGSRWLFSRGASVACACDCHDAISGGQDVIW